MYKLFIGIILTTLTAWMCQGQDKVYTSFQFLDAKGTKLKDAFNDSGPGFDVQINGCRTTDRSIGTLRIRKKLEGINKGLSWVNLISSYQKITQGEVYAKIVIDRWRLSGDANEQLMFSFHENVGDVYRIAAVTFDRVGSNEMELTGIQNKWGNNLFAYLTLSEKNSGYLYEGPLTLVLGVNLDASTYSVWFDEGNGLELLGAKAIEPFYSIGALRMRVKGTWDDYNPWYQCEQDFMDIDELVVGNSLQAIGY